MYAEAGISGYDAAAGTVSIAADQVIIARGAQSDSRLANALRTAGLEMYEIGDGTGVSYIEGAIRDAAVLARML